MSRIPPANMQSNVDGRTVQTSADNDSQRFLLQSTAPVGGSNQGTRPVNSIARPITASTESAELANRSVQNAQGTHPVNDIAQIHPIAQSHSINFFAQSHPINAVAQSHPINAVAQSHSINFFAQSHPINSTAQSHPINATAQSHPINAIVQRNRVNATSQRNSVDATAQSHPINAIAQSHPINAIVQRNRVNATAQRNSVNATAQRNRIDVSTRSAANGGIRNTIEDFLPYDYASRTRVLAYLCTQVASNGLIEGNYRINQSNLPDDVTQQYAAYVYDSIKDFLPLDYASKVALDAYLYAQFEMLVNDINEGDHNLNQIDIQYIGFLQTDGSRFFYHPRHVLSPSEENSLFQSFVQHGIGTYGNHTSVDETLQPFNSRAFNTFDYDSEDSFNSGISDDDW